ncbi:hypothetical protein ACEPAI_2735 [Sanghuangporus weigelae]
MDEKSLFTTGAFAWTRFSEELYLRRLDYGVRVMTIEQVLSSGYTNEEVCAGCANDSLASDFAEGIAFHITCADIHPFRINSFSSAQKDALNLNSSKHSQVLEMPPAIATEADSDQDVLGNHENDPISAPDGSVGGFLGVASNAPAEVIETADRKTIESLRILLKIKVYAEEFQYRLQIAVASAIALVLGVIMGK